LKAAGWAAAAVVASAGLLGPALVEDLRIPDEPRVAHTSLEMVRTGDYVLPRVNGEPFLQTPPLHYWILGAWLQCAGTRPDGLARVPSVVASLGVLAATTALARRHAGARAAFFSAAALAGFAGFWDGGQRAVVDPTLALFTTIALAHCATAFVENSFSPALGFIAGASAGFAFLAKGLPGPVTVAAPWLAAIVFLARRQDAKPVAVHLVAAAGAFVVVALPWTVALGARSPSYVAELLFTHVSARFLEGAHHDPSNFQFVHRSLVKLLPWGALLPLALALAFQRARARDRAFTGASVGDASAAARTAELAERAFADRRRRLIRLSRFLLAWLILPAALLLLSRSKRNIYLLPLYPPAALLIGLWVDRLLERGHAARPWVGAAALTLLLLPAIGVFVHHRQEAEDSLLPLGRILAEREANGATVRGFGLIEREVAAVAWYLGHPFEAIPVEDGSWSRARPAIAGDIVIGGAEELRAAAAAAGVALDPAGVGGWALVAELTSRRRTLQAWARRS